jgi:hypothetical protein
VLPHAAVGFAWSVGLDRQVEQSLQSSLAPHIRSPHPTTEAAHGSSRFRHTCEAEGAPRKSCALRCALCREYSAGGNRPIGRTRSAAEAQLLAAAAAAAAA